MIASEAVRAARKKKQLERLAEKSDPEKIESYPEYYANIPAQKVKAEASEHIRDARQEVRATAEALQIAEITGEGLLNAEEKAKVAVLVLEKLVAAQQPNAQMILTSVGGV